MGLFADYKRHVMSYGKSGPHLEFVKPLSIPLSYKTKQK